MPSSHAVAVLIVSPDGIPLVRDPKKPAPRYWKLPGGRSHGNETPEECAAREIDEELGLEIEIDDLHMIEQYDRGSHTLTFFKLQLASLHGINAIGNEGEEIKVFAKYDLTKIPDLFPNHFEVIQKAL
ncbi:MAG TPA: NUDIX domain-containing protein [Candidatus Paceibacterota bacterium]